MLVSNIMILDYLFIDIGPQGIVHGTTLTVLNAGRKYLGLEDLSGIVFVSVIAEVNSM
jgi:urocanate hydratase